MTLRTQNKKEHQAWIDARRMCYNPKHPSHELYKSKNIGMYSGWRGNFEAFFAYVGKAPSQDCYLARIDTGKDYEPGNIAWVDNGGAYRPGAIKLNETIARYIRNGKASASEVVKKYGCSYSAVRTAKRGFSWLW